MEGAPAVTVAAADAGIRTQRQAPVVLCRQGIPRTGQVIILVDEAHVQAGGAGLAVVAVHTAPGHVDRITAAENMDIAALFIGHIVVFYRLQHFFHGVAADNHNFYAVAVQTILNTLRNRHSPPLPFHQRR